jgi:hypothetical protein
MKAERRAGNVAPGGCSPARWTSDPVVASHTAVIARLRYAWHGEARQARHSEAWAARITPVVLPHLRPRPDGRHLRRDQVPSRPACTVFTA